MSQTPPLNPLKKDREADAVTAKRRVEEERARLRAEVTHLCEDPIFVGFVIRHMADVDGKGSTVISPVFSAQSNDLIRREAKREFAQMLLDEIFKVNPATYNKIMGALMNARVRPTK